jgi:hypothetical protein
VSFSNEKSNEFVINVNDTHPFSAFICFCRGLSEKRRIVFPDIDCQHRTKAEWFDYMKPEDPEFTHQVHKKSMVPLDELHHYFDPVSCILCVFQYLFHFNSQVHSHSITGNPNVF